MYNQSKHIVSMINESETKNNVDDLITYAIDNHSLKGIEEEIYPEHISPYFAFELLVPYEVSIKLLEDKTIDSYDIANTFMIPRKYINIFRSSEYILLRHKAYN